MIEPEPSCLWRPGGAVTAVVPVARRQAREVYERLRRYVIVGRW